MDKVEMVKSLMFDLALTEEEKQDGKIKVEKKEENVIRFFSP